MSPEPAVDFSTMSCREKTEIAQSIGARYMRARRHVDLAVHEPRIRIDDSCLEDLRFAWKVDRALGDLSAEQQMIIRREYLEPADHTWYRCYYTKTTFYRRRAASTDTFLRCLLN